jgi:hypothetical protein
MLIAVSASLAAALSLLQVPPAAPKIDFTGVWTIDRARSQSSPDDGSSVEPTTLTIKQTASEISIETTRAGKSWVRTYPIESMPRPGSAGIAAGRTRAYFDGARLITEAAGNIQGQTVSLRDVRTLNAAGTEMTVEALVVVQHGYSIGGARNYGTARDIFIRK